MSAASAAHAYTGNAAGITRLLRWRAAALEQVVACHGTTTIGRVAKRSLRATAQDRDGESALQRPRSIPSGLEARMTKMQSYLDVFSEQGINGDMRKFNVEKVATFAAVKKGHNRQDRVFKAARYAAIFDESMSGAQRMNAVRRVAEDPGGGS